MVWLHHTLNILLYTGSNVSLWKRLLDVLGCPWYFGLGLEQKSLITSVVFVSINTAKKTWWSVHHSTMRPASVAPSTSTTTHHRLAKISSSSLRACPRLECSRIRELSPPFSVFCKPPCWIQSIFEWLEVSFYSPKPSVVWATWVTLPVLGEPADRRIYPACRPFLLWARRNGDAQTY